MQFSLAHCNVVWRDTTITSNLYLGGTLQACLCSTRTFLKEYNTHLAILKTHLATVVKPAFFPLLHFFRANMIPDTQGPVIITRGASYDVEPCVGKWGGCVCLLIET